MNRIFAPLAAATGGVAVGLSLTPRSSGFFFSSDVTYMVGGFAAAAAMAAVVALVVAMVPRRHLVAVVIGMVLIAAVTLSIDETWTTFVRAIGAGLLLGGLACRTADHVPLVLGVLSGALMVPPLEWSGTPQRYADYMPLDDAFSFVRSDVVVLGFVVATALLLVVSRGSSTVDSTGFRPRELVVGIVVPAAGLVLYWSMTSAIDTMESLRGRWLLGIVIVPVVIVAAWLLPGRTGAVLLPMLAYVVARDPNTSLRGDSWLWSLVPIALVAVGALVGRRWPNPVAGVAIMAIVSAATVLDAPPQDIVRSVGVLFVLPVVAAYAVSACLPTSAPVSTTASTLPLTVTVPLVATFGWTAYTPLTDSRSEPAFSNDAWQWLSAGVATGSIVVIALVLAWLRRARPATP
ncbi:hypothetical protein ACNHUS_05140 [Actinomycetes bacterium M1A6_2h]